MFANLMYVFETLCLIAVVLGIWYFVITLLMETKNHPLNAKGWVALICGVILGTFGMVCVLI